MKQKKIIFSLFLFLAASTFLFAQKITIRGIVTDEQGMPMPGVNIQEKDGTTGTTSGFDGDYQISANKGSVLVFSFIGYKTSEIIANGEIVDMKMASDAKELDGVVVTALGIKRDQKSLGYATQKVRVADVVTVRDADLNSALAGKVAGVQFQGSPSADFRTSTLRLRGNTEILYVVDNIKVVSISDINPESIESINTLKGLSATALYGPEGRNGAIVITTKKGKKGTTSVEFNVSSSLENVYGLPEFQNEYGGGYSQTFPKYTYNAANDPASFAAFDGQDIVDYTADESWGPRMQGQMVRAWNSWEEGTPEFGKLTPYSANPNNVKDFYNTGVTNRTSLSAGKGGEDYNINFGITKTSKEGVVPNTARTQYDVNVTAEANLSKKFKVYSTILFQDRETTGYNDKNLILPAVASLRQWFQRQLNMDDLRNYRMNGKIVTWNRTSATNGKSFGWNSPFFDQYEQPNKEDNKTFNGRFGASYEIINGLTATAELRKNYLGSAYYDITNAWGGVAVPKYEESLAIKNRDEVSGILNYKKKINKFDIAATGGFEYQFYDNTYMISETVGGLVSDGFYSISTSVGIPLTTNRRFKSETRGFFTTASVGYDDFLYVDGSYRNDFSSTANVNDNKLTTYGVSGSFIFSKFIPENTIFTFGKIRAGYAMAPQFPNAYQTSPVYTTGTTYGTYPTSSTPGTLVNPSLTGGNREEKEYGVDLKFFNNRLSLDASYFDRLDNGIPYRVSFDGSTGINGVFLNQGEQTYKGYEVALSGSPIKTNSFEWNIGVNFATLERKVVAIADGIDRNVIQSGNSNMGNVQLVEQVGEEWGAIYGSRIARDENGKAKLTAAGAYVRELGVYLGNILPNYTGGLTTSFTYKNFDLSLGFDFQQGGKYYSVSNSLVNRTGVGIETVGNNDLGNPKRDPIVNATTGASIATGAMLNSAVTPTSGGLLVEGVDGTTGADVAYRVSTRTYWSNIRAITEPFLEDASYVKLRTMRLGYNFSKTILSKTPFQKINLAVYANNLWLIYAVNRDIDPSELQSYNTTGTPFIETAQLPNSRSIGLNLVLTL
ncbi:SusC/RagA family TonB-linked outer membrane protein [Flavobacterium sp. GA093]|uniref:SusC/RagA family TonB-linked outer membrane protein n=1 Tax=Flavobacterium hydrocarbonoxydans TaxID=2683249 RepID=A0A6I4NQZ8_9FLAO|nr:SusC/RagA family TonB-linked outer membrane protein [Flavobacterium hydrocarbonoxydans]MWB95402.1 SusC/RagA family TonB-linked outer membrane protein [Flavobacterium hydrocarbonoxydans]